MKRSNIVVRRWRHLLATIFMSLVLILALSVSVVHPGADAAPGASPAAPPNAPPTAIPPTAVLGEPTSLSPVATRVVAADADTPTPTATVAPLPVLTIDGNTSSPHMVLNGTSPLAAVSGLIPTHEATFGITSLQCPDHASAGTAVPVQADNTGMASITLPPQSNTTLYVQVSTEGNIWSNCIEVTWSGSLTPSPTSTPTATVMPTATATATAPGGPVLTIDGKTDTPHHWYTSIPLPVSVTGLTPNAASTLWGALTGCPHDGASSPASLQITADSSGTASTVLGVPANPIAYYQAQDVGGAWSNCIEVLFDLTSTPTSTPTATSTATATETPTTPPTVTPTATSTPLPTATVTRMPTSTSQATGTALILAVPSPTKASLVITTLPDTGAGHGGSAGSAMALLGIGFLLMLGAIAIGRRRTMR